MDSEQLAAFLKRTGPALVGVVATIRSDGSPHAVPVWYRWDGEVVNIWTLDGRRWVANIRRDQRVGFSVQETEPPFAAVVMRGTAQVMTDAGPEVDQEIRAIAHRYLAEAELDDYLAAWAEARTLVRIHPSAIRSWTRGY
jgi:PPOX class probable F420-dependent enzyme